MSARNETRMAENIMPENILQKNFNVPVQITDLSSFDDAFFSMKERFQAEMRRVDEEMTRFSTTLTYLYGQPVPGIPSSDESAPQPANWESIANSPLVTGEGESKILKLQFHVSSFSPDEITVKIIDNVLIVTALHDEKTDTSAAYREYHREFLLPRGIDAAAVVSSMSRDGVLTIQTPMPQLTERTVLRNPQRRRNTE